MDFTDLLTKTETAVSCGHTILQTAHPSQTLSCPQLSSMSFEGDSSNSPLLLICSQYTTDQIAGNKANTTPAGCDLRKENPLNVVLHSVIHCRFWSDLSRYIFHGT